MPDGRITVASIPDVHVYLSHILPLDGGGPVRLPHPLLSEAEIIHQTRWPAVRLPLEWVQRAEYDVLHIQFDFDVYTVEELAWMADVVHERGKPLLYTLHDLRNPHRPEPGLHEEQLDVLVPRADMVLTLTRGAAGEIERRWGRTAEVVPHPHVVDFTTMERLGRRESGSEFRVGMHLRYARASIDPAPLVPVLVEVMRDLPGAVLEVYLHREVLDPDGDRRDLARQLTAAAGRGELELHPHAHMSDEQLWLSLSSLDATVLPYRYGTHSGWLEACRDLGVTVIAPSCGFYTDQGPVLPFVYDEHRFDPDTLQAAVLEAYERRPRLGASVADRREERALIAAAHDRLYRQALSVQVG